MHAHIKDIIPAVLDPQPEPQVRRISKVEEKRVAGRMAVTESHFSRYETAGPSWTESDTAFATLAKQKAVQAAYMMLTGHRPRNPTVSLIGQTSVGKTMLARLLLAFWRKYGKVEAFWSGGSECVSGAVFINWPSHHYSELEDAIDCAVVVIDELGRGSERGGAGVATDRAIDLLNRRQMARRWTIITSNLNDVEMRAKDPAMFERIRRDGGMAVCAGNDVRPFNDRL